MHWTLSGFNTFKNVDRNQTFMLWWASGLPEIGWCGFFTLRWLRLDFNVGCRGGGLVVHLSIISFFCSMPSLTHSVYSTSESQVWHCMTQILAHTCTHYHQYASLCTKDWKQMKEFLYYWNSFTDVNATIHVQSNSDVYKVDIFNILGFLMFV